MLIFIPGVCELIHCLNDSHSYSSILPRQPWNSTLGGCGETYRYPKLRTITKLIRVRRDICKPQITGIGSVAKQMSVKVLKAAGVRFKLGWDQEITAYQCSPVRQPRRSGWSSNSLSDHYSSFQKLAGSEERESASRQRCRNIRKLDSVRMAVERRGCVVRKTVLQHTYQKL